jgi:hypothetical protein
MYVAVWPQGQPGKDGTNLSQDNFRYPVVDSLVHDGVTWYCIRFDTSFTDGPNRTGEQPDRFAVDLNDNLFTPCDTVCFVFCAINTNGDATYWTPFTGTIDDQWEALNNPAEFTILPAGGFKAGGDILYVDGMNARGAQPFFDTAFDALGLSGLVDRYDVRGPSSAVSNRPGARVVDVFQQLLGVYRKIIWNTGDLTITIGDGTGNPEKADDATMLFAFIDNLPTTGGLYFNGDDFAESWDALGGSAIALKAYLAYTTTNTNHVSAGLGINPYSVGEIGSCFDHILGVDTVVAYGGCNLINDFDVISATGTATQEMSYHGNGITGGSIVGQKTNNSAGFDVGVIMAGFSYHYIRDDRPGGNQYGVLDRIEHMRDILVWLDNTPAVPTPVRDPGMKTSLSQNYPNPFNPTTTIDFALRETSRVQLKVYNVAGQLVRTLVNEDRSGETLHTVRWDGRNDAGQLVSSGVYFYKLVAKDFVQTKKMVLLK